MSVSLKSETEKAVPVAREQHSKKIIYIIPEENRAEPITRRRFDGKRFQCNMCQNWFNSIQGYKYHIEKVCVMKPKYEVSTKNEIDPLPTEQRQVLYIAGAQNSGKSYRVMKFIHYWRNMFPKRRIIMISRLNTDETFSKSEHGDLEKHLIRMKPNIEWLKQKFEMDDFKNCLVVFDDIVSSNWSDDPDPKKSAKENKMIQDYVRDLAIDMCQNGRHSNIHLVITSHDLYDGHITSKLLKDATDFIIFPGTTGTHHLMYFLRNYCGMLQKQIMRILSLKSRWILIHKNDPKYVMYSNGVYRYDILGLGGVEADK